jgi:hypothetical protein
MTKWRTVLTVASFIYCAGLILFALHPIGEVHWSEWVVIVLAGVAQLTMITWFLPDVSFPGEEYAFLLVGWAGFTTLLFYLIGTDDDPLRRMGVALFLLAGMFAGYGAFLVQDQTTERRR